MDATQLSSITKEDAQHMLLQYISTAITTQTQPAVSIVVADLLQNDPDVKKALMDIIKSTLQSLGWS